MYETIFCRNCGRKSLTDYFNFCSIICCADFAVKQGIEFNSAKYIDSEDESEIRKLEYGIEDLESEVRAIEEDNNDLRREIRKKKEDIENEVDIEVRDKLGRLEVTESNFRSVKKDYVALVENFEKLEKKNKKLELKNKELEEKNKVLRNKFTRFEIMDI